MTAYPETPEARLAAADKALTDADVELARALAQSVLTDAKNRADTLWEARALSCLAHCDRIDSRLRRATETSRLAAQLFEQVGDTDGEANALMTLAQVSMLLGRNEEAVEAALLSVRLCNLKAPRPLAALALNSLGLAYSWSGDHERAYTTLETAVDVARRCDPAISVYQPRLNQVWVEASRLVDERYHTSSMKSIHRLAELMEECVALEDAGQGVAPMPGLQSIGRTLSLTSQSLVLIWQGKLVAARSALESAAQSLSGVLTWRSAFVRWGAAELAWAEGDLALAVRELTEMKEMALAVDHEQLACRAHLLLMQVCELQGNPEGALREYRALRMRERRVVADGLGSRESLVSWRLGARQSERHLQQALVASRQFERWSLEDALTGIANRRHFEQALAQAMQTAVGPESGLSVAMVDVDKFKSVNDRFSHRVGDRVLKTIAALICANVRAKDLPARWAGDEFVVLFKEANREVAQEVCARIRSAVADFEWDSVAPGLQVSVTIGLSAVRTGDTADSVLHRSDQSMYGAKTEAANPV
jgi:diguanylate cyclase (GGDEF)-like protein